MISYYHTYSSLYAQVMTSLLDEIGKDAATGKVVVKVNPKFYRPAEVDLLLGNPSKAEKELGWKREVSFKELVSRMVRNDLVLVEKEIKADNI